MIATSDLIELLASRAGPVRRLRPPGLRAGGWLCGAGLVLAALTLSQGLRPDLIEQLQSHDFVMSLIAGIATAICAATAAFKVVVPGRSSLWMWLPLPPLLVWLSTIGYQCITNWVSVDPAGMHAGDTLRCFATLLLTSVPLWLIMIIMLRRARPIETMMPMVAGSLAVAATTAIAMNLVHPLDATVMILVWNFGVGALIVLSSAVLGRRLLMASN